MSKTHPPISTVVEAYKHAFGDTPETDAQIFDACDGQGCEAVLAGFARKLERERDEALNKAHNYEQGYLTYATRADTLEKERDEARENLTQTQKAWTDVCIERTKFAIERDEAREALRVLFKDYKELADSGDAGFWELEDKEAAQPALRILQQMDAINQTTKPEQVSSKLARYKKDAEVVTDKQEVFRRLVEAIVTTHMTADTLLEIRRLFGDEIDAAVACLRRTAK